MATNFESPLPIASFLNTYFANLLRVSKIKKDIKEALNPFNKNKKSINLFSSIFKNISPKIPEINPKFIKL